MDTRKTTKRFRQQSEEFSDNDNADYFDDCERIHSQMYQNGYLQHVFTNGGALAGPAAAEMMCEMSANNTNATTATAAVASGTPTNNGHNNRNVDVNGKTAPPAPNSNTLSSSKSSSSNQSMDVLPNVLPNYQPRWHHQLMHSTFALRNPLHPSLIKAHLDSVNHEIAQLDSRIESILLKQHQAMNQSQALAEINAATIYRNPKDTMIGNGGDNVDAAPAAPTAYDTTVISASTPTTAQLDNKFSNISNGAPHSLNASKAMPATTSAAAAPVHSRYPLGATQQIDSETEHIYETIPEDSESEPIYCSPYRGETDSESNIVHEWLNLKDEQHQQQHRRCNDASSSKTNWTRSTKSNSSVEDHENSSSAYNTGGSCNSNHQLTLELSDTNLDDGNKTLVFCPTKHLQPKFPASAQHQQHDSKSPTVRQSMPSSGGGKKEKVLSPTHNNRRSECHNEQNVTRKSNSNHQGNVLTKTFCYCFSKVLRFYVC